MKCPKCGYRRQDRDSAFTPATECPACGIVYSKHLRHQPASAFIGAAPPPHLRQSPVAAVSLLKAKDRVEKRLRKQLENSIRDQRHETTLKLARRFASQEIRKRQEDWTNLGDTADPEPEDFQIMAPMPHLEASADVEAKREQADQAMFKEFPAESKLDEAPEGSDVEVQTIVLESSDTAITDNGEGVYSDDTPPKKAAPLLLGKLARGKAHRNATGGGMMRLLPSIAWLMLVCGVIGAFLSWTTISDVEAGVNLPVPSTLTTLPLGLLLGFAYLATGALGFAFFWVSSLINRQLREIRRLLLTQPASHVPKDKFEPNYGVSPHNP